MERRKMERFELSLPATFTATSTQREQKTTTKDICTGGVFFETDQELSEGTEVSMKIMITPPENRIVDKRTFVELHGIVARQEGKGFAVQFDSTGHFIRI